VGGTIQAINSRINDKVTADVVSRDMAIRAGIIKQSNDQKKA
jgi:hypothetical protein